MLLPINHDLRGQSRRIIHHFADRNAVEQIDIIGDTVLLRDDRNGIRIPFGEFVAFLDLGTLVDEEPRTIRYTVTGPLALLFIE